MAHKQTKHSSSSPHVTQEKQRLNESATESSPWRRWGPYVSERSWGTVREDYSPDGEAWGYLTHDMARSKAYRWGEDGLGAICDRYQLLCFSLGLWNGNDPILKERAFGVTPQEGNHGEDVKEYYFYIDSTPTHSYMRYLYKYPQATYPYQQLIDENRAREGHGDEFELIDTGLFDEDRYFDVFVDYAKATPEDMCIRIEVHNRGPEDAPLHIMPNLWFRNTWTWTEPKEVAPVISSEKHKNSLCLIADDTASTGLTNLPFQYQLGQRRLYGEIDGELLFTNNETNNASVHGTDVGNETPFTKDAFHRHIINGEESVNPDGVGTKACMHYTRIVPAGEKITLRFRLTPEMLEKSAG